MSETFITTLTTAETEIDYTFERKGKANYMKMIGKVITYKDGRPTKYYSPTEIQKGDPHSYFGCKWRCKEIDGAMCILWDDVWLELFQIPFCTGN